MRVVVYNVRGLRAGPGVVAAPIADLHPDVVIVTEAGTRRRLHRFAGGLGMVAHHGSLPPLLPRVRNAVLVPSDAVVDREGSHAFQGQRRLERRGAFFARVALGGRACWIVSVHLGLEAGRRRDHASELLRLVRRLEEPVLVGGDLNEPPDLGAAAVLGEIGWDAWTRMGFSTGETFPATEPHARIDYLFTSRDVRVERAFVPTSAALRSASDHLPVVVDLVW